MTTETNPVQSANAIIAQALADAGVPPRNIQLPAESPQGTPKESESGSTLKSAHKDSNGTPKGEVSGHDTDTAESEDSVQSVSTKPPAAKSAVPVAPQLGKSEIEQLLNQTSAKFQSIIDRKINAIQAQLTGTITALNQFFQAQDATSISGLPESEQVLKRLERLEKGNRMPQIQVQQPIESQSTQFYQQLVNFVDAVGLHVDDKRIDWAPDVSDPKTGFNRFLASIKTALVEDQTKVIQELKASTDKELTKIRKKTGIDRVSTSGPSGAGNPDISKMTPAQKIEYGLQIHEMEIQQGR